MRICFALWHLNGYRGTQTWTVAAARAMKALGHEVSLYTVERGRAAMRLMPEFPVYSMSHVGEVPKQDVLVVSQPRTFFECRVCSIPVQPNSTGLALAHMKGKRNCTGSGFRMKHVLPNAKHKVYVCHGVLLWHDAPVDNRTPYVAVSEEVQMYLKTNGIDATVVRQPVDLDLYCQGPALRQTRPRALSFSQVPVEVEILQSACDEAGFELVRPPEDSLWDVVPLIHSADVVIGTGRGLCEAMATGRAAIVCGTHGCDGLVSPRTLDLLLSHNFSGRATKGEVAGGLVLALKDYDPELGPWSQDIARQHFDSKVNVQRIVEVACSK